MLKNRGQPSSLFNDKVQFLFSQGPKVIRPKGSRQQPQIHLDPDLSPLVAPQLLYVVEAVRSGGLQA